jgi:NAD(P)-dependent dehydrogenase (short-subunit alcohol dehydrogenase family)
LLPVLQTAKGAVEKVLQEWGHIDVLVNNASVQHMRKELTDISAEQLQNTFATNVFGYFFLAQVGLCKDS